MNSRHFALLIFSIVFLHCTACVTGASSENAIFIKVVNKSKRTLSRIALANDAHQVRISPYLGSGLAPGKTNKVEIPLSAFSRGKYAIIVLDKDDFGTAYKGIHIDYGQTINVEVLEENPQSPWKKITLPEDKAQSDKKEGKGKKGKGKGKSKS